MKKETPCASSFFASPLSLWIPDMFTSFITLAIGLGVAVTVALFVGFMMSFQKPAVVDPDLTVLILKHDFDDLWDRRFALGQQLSLDPYIVRGEADSPIFTERYRRINNSRIDLRADHFALEDLRCLVISGYLIQKRLGITHLVLVRDTNNLRLSNTSVLTDLRAGTEFHQLLQRLTPYAQTA